MPTLTCDRCDKSFEIDLAKSGPKVACPFCGDINRVPADTGSAPIPSSTPNPVRASPTRDDGRTALGLDSGPVDADADERVLLIVQQAMFRAHPFWYGLMVLMGLGGLVMAVVGAIGTVTLPLGWIGLGMLIAAGLWWMIWWAAPHRWIKLIVTTKRTIRREGIVMRRTSEVLHKHVTNVVIEQGFLDRVLDVGYIGLDTAGMGGESGRDGTRSGVEIEVSNIPHPYRVKQTIDQYRLG
ncbi:MAG: PH domain-containing protein [Phycisphaerales bacterium]|nr:PH domain-containing protein [Phycisphaerales bacterium]